MYILCYNLQCNIHYQRCQLWLLPSKSPMLEAMRVKRGTIIATMIAKVQQDTQTESVPFARNIRQSPKALAPFPSGLGYAGATFTNEVTSLFVDQLSTPLGIEGPNKYSSWFFHPYLKKMFRREYCKRFNPLISWMKEPKFSERTFLKKHWPFGKAPESASHFKFESIPPFEFPTHPKPWRKLIQQKPSHLSLKQFQWSSTTSAAVSDLTQKHFMTSKGCKGLVVSEHQGAQQTAFVSYLKGAAGLPFPIDMVASSCLVFSVVLFASLSNASKGGQTGSFVGINLGKTCGWKWFVCIWSTPSVSKTSSRQYHLH